MSAHSALLRKLKLFIPGDNPIWASGDYLFLTFCLHRINDHDAIRSLVDGAIFRRFYAWRVAAVLAGNRQIGNINEGILSAFFGLDVNPLLLVRGLRR